MSVIGIVRLAPGQVGYFDDLTRIHLTIASPEKPVISGMNTNNLKRAVKSGRILLSSGSLDASAVKAQAPVVPEPVQEVKVEAQTQTPAESAEIKEESGTVTIDTDAALQKIQEEKEVETLVVEEPAVETAAEAVVEESAEEVDAEDAIVATTEETLVETAEVEADDTTEVKDEVDEESTETVEAAVVKKGNTKKK